MMTPTAGGGVAETAAGTGSVYNDYRGAGDMRRAKRVLILICKMWSVCWYYCCHVFSSYSTVKETGQIFSVKSNVLSGCARA